MVLDLAKVEPQTSLKSIESQSAVKQHSERLKTKRKRFVNLLNVENKIEYETLDLH